MKKIVLVMAVLMLAAPAWAVTVDVWAQQVGNTDEVEIWYETDGNLPRAFGLNISVTAGNIVDCVPAMTGESSSGDPGYGIFPGTIDISDGVVNDYGTPVAPNDAPGAEGTGIDTNEIVVEMGSLYYPATGLASPNSPLASDLLCTITVSEECDVTIVGNAARTGPASPTGKGVVMEDPDETPAVNFTGCTVVLVPPCDGDISGPVGDPDGWVNSTDETALSNYIVDNGGFLKAVWRYLPGGVDPNPDWDEKYNFTGDDWVNSADETMLSNYIVDNGGFLKAVECPGPGM